MYSYFMLHFAVVIWYEGIRDIKNPLLHEGDGFLRALTEDVNNYLVHLSDVLECPYSAGRLGRVRNTRKRN